jgi:hypothetical protein
MTSPHALDAQGVFTVAKSFRSNKKTRVDAALTRRVGPKSVGGAEAGR